MPSASAPIASAVTGRGPVARGSANARRFQPGFDQPSPRALRTSRAARRSAASAPSAVACGPPPMAVAAALEARRRGAEVDLAQVLLEATSAAERIGGRGCGRARARARHELLAPAADAVEALLRRRDEAAHGRVPRRRVRARSSGPSSSGAGRSPSGSTARRRVAIARSRPRRPLRPPTPGGAAPSPRRPPAPRRRSARRAARNSASSPNSCTGFGQAGDEAHLAQRAPGHERVRFEARRDAQRAEQLGSCVPRAASARSASARAASSASASASARRAVSVPGELAGELRQRFDALGLGEHAVAELQVRHLGAQLELGLGRLGRRVGGGGRRRGVLSVGPTRRRPGPPAPSPVAAVRRSPGRSLAAVRRRDRPGSPSAAAEELQRDDREGDEPDAARARAAAASAAARGTSGPPCRRAAGARSRERDLRAREARGGVLLQQAVHEARDPRGQAGHSLGEGRRRVVQQRRAGSRASSRPRTACGRTASGTPSRPASRGPSASPTRRRAPARAR